MHHQKVGERAEYRQQQGQRAKDSNSIADRYPQLKSLTIDLAYFNSDGTHPSTEIKYTVNINNARSVFRVDCPNSECIRGDFDLSTKLADAVSGQRATAAGELCCQGWLCKTCVGTVQCRQILRYKLSLGY